MNHVKEFFKNHPGCTEVYEALGYLFTQKEDAEKMLAGVSGQEVITHTNTDDDEPAISVSADASDADAEMKELFEEEQAAEDMPVIINDATTYGKSADEIAEFNKEKTKNQKAAKESAEKAKAKSKPKGK